MADHTGTDHVGINISYASCQVISTLYSRCMITVFPVGSLSIFSLIVFLAGSSSHQLHGLGDDIPFPGIKGEQVHVVRGYDIVQDHQFIAFLGLIQPLQIALAIL
jgi:hypothetical protein